MNEIIFYDSFSGTGGLQGRTPEIGLEAEDPFDEFPEPEWATWEGQSGSTSDTVLLSGRIGAAPDADPPLWSAEYPLESQVVTPASSFNLHTTVRFSSPEGTTFWAGAKDYYCRVTGPDWLGEWSVFAQDFSGDSEGPYGDLTIPSGVIYAGSVYDFVMVCSNAEFTVTFGGYSLTVPRADPENPCTFTGVELQSSLGTTFGPVTVYEGLTPGAPYGGFLFPMMELNFTMLVEPVFPMMQLDAYLGFGVDFAFPMPTSEYVFASALDFTFPMMKLDAGFVKNASFDFDFPMMRLDASFGASSDWTFPAMTLDAKLTNTEGKNALDFAFPVMTFDGQMGGQAGFDFPIMTLEADMTQTALIQVDFTFPAMTLDAALSGEPYKVSVDFEFPMMQVEAQFGYGAEFNLPMMTIDAHMQAGGLLNLDFALPMMTLDANLTQENHGAIEFTFPMMVPVHGITADFTIPMMRLDAHIKAVVSVTYDAYSVNLTHTAEAPTDEVTRYTNYPFDQIVRLGGDYYGVATDGLYLLGGKLDNAQPIAYTVKTCIDDFKVKEFKNIASGYFGGRIGPDMKVTVYAGEQGEESYDYSTPRGQGAQNHREKFGRGVKNRYYAIGVSGDQDFELDNIELEINKMSRRI